MTGKDEYASNCTGTLERQGLKITLATADSQLVLSVEAPRCANPDKAEERNWFRVDLEGLSARERHSLVYRAFESAKAQLGMRCGETLGKTKVHFDPPDLTVRGAP